MTTTREFREFRNDLIEQVLATGKADPGKNDNELSLLVYGVTNYQTPLWQWSRSTDQQLSLIREPANRYSPHAIAVLSSCGRIGYLPDTCRTPRLRCWPRTSTAGGSSSI